MGNRPLLRVVVWSTGGVGSRAVAAVARRPDFELVGVWVHSADKVGLDAGELAGIDHLGVPATNDAQALIDLAPDCVVYAASSPKADAVAIPDYERLLRAGINVVTVSSPGLIYPAGFEASARDRLAAAAEAGGSTLYASGIEPGFAADHFVLTLLTGCKSVRSIRVQELFCYHSYPVEYVMRDVMGFGHPLEYTPIMALIGVQQITWGPPLRMIADALGVELDGIRETYDRAVTPRDLDTAVGVIEAGTVGAVRFETIGVVNGRDAIVIEHVNRMAMDIAPEWPSAARDGTYRVMIDGEPPMQCELTLGDERSFSDDGMLVTTMRVVNAIPAVCAAAPGLVSALDLPLTLPLHAL